MSKPNTACPHCGEQLDASDLVEIVVAKPESCICNPNDWRLPHNIPPVCSNYVLDEAERDGLCLECEHEKGCHKESV